jgi:hypothetical protein
VYFRKENGNITGNKIEDRISLVKFFNIEIHDASGEQFYFSTY